MALTRYKRKRNFSATPEPSAQKTTRTTKSHKLTFVVQEHHATSLHFDFRLEMEGVLRSWAVPKGPSLDPKDKHLAMHVEDHPLSYGTFHGAIPEGNYGAGEVRIWDHGWYEMVGDEKPEVQFRAGNLKFILHGKKLKGEFHLVQMHRDGEEKAWLLFKHKDDRAEPGWKIEPILHFGSRTQNPKATKAKTVLQKRTSHPDARETAPKTYHKQRSLKRA